MIVVQPWMLAIAGTALAIGSMIVSEVIAKRLLRQADDADKEAEEAEQKVTSGQRLEANAHADLAQAELLLAIVQGRPSQEPSPSDDYHRITSYIIEGICNRISAATGSPQSDDVIARMEPLTKRAVKGEPAAFSSLFEEADAYLLRFAEYNNEQVERRNSARRTRRLLDSRSERIRRLALGLQILGLVVILLKDVIATAP